MCIVMYVCGRLSYIESVVHVGLHKGSSLYLGERERAPH